MPSQFEATAGLAIGTTSGGTVTQATNKATGVTLNTESGQITMNAAALGDGAYVTFAVTNDRVSATDVVNVGHGSGGTAGGYVVVNSAVAAVTPHSQKLLHAAVAAATPDPYSSLGQVSRKYNFAIFKWSLNGR